MSGSFNPPANPTDGQIYSFGGATWVWSASKGVWTNANTGANFLPIGGGTLTGPLILSGNAAPATPLQATPLQQVNTIMGANVGRNLLHNGLFNVQQRGAGPWTVQSLTADRWSLGVVTDTASASIVALADTDRTAIGDEAAQSAIQVVFTGSSTANAQTNVNQRIENVRRLGGKTVTGQFWARATSGTPRVGLSSYQYFGTGGSPSTGVFTSFGATAALSSTWTRYIISGTLPTTSGKTLGTTAGTDFTQLTLVLSDQANAHGTGIGVQSGTVQIWGAQLEIVAAVTTPPTVTPLEKLDPETDLAHCQRFYQQVAIFNTQVPSATAQLAASASFAVAMRATPTMTININSSSGLTGLTPGPLATLGGYILGNATANTLASFNVNLIASADL